jgi:hypothetical protein
MGSHQVEGTQRCAEASHNASRHFRGRPSVIGSGDELAIPAMSSQYPWWAQTALGRKRQRRAALDGENAVVR